MTLGGRPFNGGNLRNGYVMTGETAIVSGRPVGRRIAVMAAHRMLAQLSKWDKLLRCPATRR